MKAITQTTFGSADVLHLSEVSKPSPGAGEVVASYPLSASPEAVRHLEAGRVRGKLAISVRAPLMQRRLPMAEA